MGLDDTHANVVSAVDKTAARRLVMVHLLVDLVGVVRDGLDVTLLGQLVARRDHHARGVGHAARGHHADGSTVGHGSAIRSGHGGAIGGSHRGAIGSTIRSTVHLACSCFNKKKGLKT